MYIRKIEGLVGYNVRSFSTLVNLLGSTQIYVYICRWRNTVIKIVYDVNCEYNLLYCTNYPRKKIVVWSYSLHYSVIFSFTICKGNVRVQSTFKIINNIIIKYD